jgi:peptide-methionine (S)-S-oxide reductase
MQGTPAGLEAGVAVQLSNGARAVVKDVSDETIKLDANHMLAGKALTFDVELVDVTKGN